VNIRRRRVTGKNVSNALQVIRISRVMLDKGPRTAILPMMNGTMLLRSSQPTVQNAESWLNSMARTILEYQIEKVAYFATLVEKLLRPQGGHQVGEFIRGLRLIFRSNGCETSSLVI
jgi:hypothetical protein